MTAQRKCKMEMTLVAIDAAKAWNTVLVENSDDKRQRFQVANSRANSRGVRPARTSSTICRRNSGGYGGRVFGTVNSFFKS